MKTSERRHRHRRSIKKFRRRVYQGREWQNKEWMEECITKGKVFNCRCPWCVDNKLKKHFRNEPDESF